MLAQDRKQSLTTKEIYISCIVPIYNEGTLIKEFLTALASHLQQLSNNYEIIVVDDGSKDNSVPQIIDLSNKFAIKILSLSRNFGKEAALTAGIDHAKGDVAILLDADFQHPIPMITTFLQTWADGYDMVYGIRNNRNTDKGLKRLCTKLFYWFMTKTSKLDMPANAGDFRLLDRKIITALQQLPERTRFMKGLYAWVGYNSLGLPFEVQRRLSGHSSFSLLRLCELASIGITSFSNIPLRIWSLIGLLISCSAVIYGMYVVASTICYGSDLPGFPTIVAAIVFLGGIQLLSIGILGEYIARIFTEVKQRPIYIIGSKHGFPEN
jgi:glycosyltransferase involved in cell wall biosynthesis